MSSPLPFTDYRLVVRMGNKSVIACKCGARRTVPTAEWRRHHIPRSCAKCFMRTKAHVRSRPGIANRRLDPEKHKHPLLLFRCPKYEGLSLTPGGCARAHQAAKDGVTRLHPCLDCPIGKKYAEGSVE